MTESTNQSQRSGVQIQLVAVALLARPHRQHLVAILAIAGASEEYSRAALRADDEHSQGSARHRDLLFDIWLRSVRATHDFVSPEDVQSIIPLVKDYLASGEPDLVVSSADGAAKGFMDCPGARWRHCFSRGISRAWCRSPARSTRSDPSR